MLINCDYSYFVYYLKNKELTDKLSILYFAKLNNTMKNMKIDVSECNSKAWDNEVKNNNIWSRPVDSKAIADAAMGSWSLLLTPTKSVPASWFGEVENKDILCLASGGGQQAPILAAAGANVSLLDNSLGQLKQDKYVCERDNLNIAIKQGKMQDLSCYKDESFDLIFHPVSNCFVSSVLPVWQECYRVLRKGGRLLAGFTNPLVYIFDFNEWDNKKKLAVRYKIPYSDIDQLPKEELEQRIKSNQTLEFGHSLADQIGGQLKAGFILKDMYEDNYKIIDDWLLNQHIDTFMATLAIK